MAGTFTHFMVCRTALERATAEISEAVGEGGNYMYLGAVSPDIPYLAIPQENGDSLSCADYMHSYRTNGIPREAVGSMGDTYKKTSEIEQSKFSWTLGYIAHLVIDAVIHPIVEMIVGPYKHRRNRPEHLRCEMVQDAFVFKEVIGEEISGGFIEANLSNVNSGTLTFWGNTFFDIYFPGIFEVMERNGRPTSIRPKKSIWDIRGRRFQVEYLRNGIKPARWMKWYLTLLRGATEDTFKKLSRHTSLRRGLIYRSTEKIMADSPGDVEKYFKSVKLPGRASKGNFMKFGFERAVNNVLRAWKVAYRGVTKGQDITSFVKNWNLDTGLDQETGKMTFWA